ncbi:hypothetical protein CSIV_02180 [Microbacterium sp. CSI-V]|uniref:hypothetical protein n=1 Tax=unclassified Microbacterium TaxID=2609290 RepID=UPI00097C4D49|nr:MULTISPECIES: hypothetical protein [unclassified Microbacterium]MXS75199.1 hypothetical protein [Microbacterium sp. TL13]ONI66438.1 hypothetical protein CSIV_02180 [Microbacterium sp. CSI-V]
MSVPRIPVGSPQGIRSRGATAFVWWGPGAEGMDRVAVVESRVLLFASPESCLAWAGEAGSSRDERAETEVVDLDAVRPWLDRATPTIDLAEALGVVNMAIDVAASTGRSWDPRVGAHRGAYRRFVAAAVPWAFADADAAPAWSAREFGSAQSMVRRSIALLDRALAEGRPTDV